MAQFTSVAMEHGPVHKRRPGSSPCTRPSKMANANSLAVSDDENHHHNGLWMLEAGPASISLRKGGRPFSNHSRKAMIIAEGYDKSHETWLISQPLSRGSGFWARTWVYYVYPKAKSTVTEDYYYVVVLFKMVSVGNK